MTSTHEIIKLAKKLESPNSAQKFFHNKLSREILNLINIKQAKNIIEFEEIIYFYLVRKFEDEENAKIIYSLYDRLINKMTDEMLKDNKDFLKPKTKLNNEITFFIHNLESPYAHVEVLKLILDSMEIKTKIFIVGFCRYGEMPSSYLINLAKKKGIIIDIIHYKNAMITYENLSYLINYVNSCKSKNFIFLSTPVFLSILSKLFKNICLFCLKFNYDKKVFPNLKKVIQTQDFDFGYFDKTEIRNFREKNYNIIKKKTIFYSIGRYDKLNNKNFIKLIISVLKNNKNSDFHYASDKKLENLDKELKIENLDNNIVFLGWVNIKKKIKYGDVFLDCEHLSGTIAAKVFASGMPIAFFLNNNFHITSRIRQKTIVEILNKITLKNSFLKKVFIKTKNYENEKYIIYKKHINKMINDKIYLNEYVKISKKISDKIFFNRNNISKFFKYITE